MYVEVLTLSQCNEVMLEKCFNVTLSYRRDALTCSDP